MDDFERRQEAKFHKMTETPVGRLICELAVPCIVSMLITAFYNMADTYFVGMLKSNSATGAVGVVFSMMAIIQAVGFFFGQGSGNYISRELGSHHIDEASKMASTGFFFAMLAGLVICVAGIIFLEPLTYLLGATDTILPYAKSYLRIILIGAPWMTASIVLNNQLRYQGSAAYGMIGITAGAVLNIALDPLLIFVFDMGIAGAALATIISQLVSCIILFIQCTKGGNIAIRPANFTPRWSYFRLIIQGGLPSLGRQGLASLATICLNRAAGPYGDAAIAAMSVVQRIAMFGGSTIIGFGQGFQPVCGFNFGAKLYKRVMQGFWFCVRVAFIFLVCVSALGALFAPQLIALFRDDPEVIAYGTRALRFQCITFSLQSWIVMSNMMTQSIGKTVPATFLAVARQGIFFIPTVLILPQFLGFFGVQITQCISDTLSFCCAVPIALMVLRELKQLAQAQE